MCDASGCEIKSDDGQINATTGPPFFSVPEDADWTDEFFAKDPHAIYVSASTDLNKFLDAHAGDGESFINRMVFSQHISALEAYLSDTLLKEVTDKRNSALALVEKDDDLGKRRFTLKEIAGDADLVSNTVLSYLRSVVYHNLPRVNALYRIVFTVDLFGLFDDDERSKLMAAINHRHDCVHRNGRNDQGETLGIFTVDYVKEISTILRKLVDGVEDRLMGDLPF